ncbi:DUF417 family protein [Shewanella fidelis]|uniref:DUF417 family protein n=1 Tax=Shewanella fidelis TaxID=173509 RepID=A0AAW8NSV1_9GAMM|nr:DUF417 family protein [Shewanella fidelis]MDR8526198.1 DUF417 family protein [Shewanella fidelis]MDW4814057.1 DUF417 family protein [Shewanella fidelis]MDW4818228.1 DUF417 family protein [Shewanella fidelis]MDW4822346.1 DUF417 family protein [Shewanella fidelis]MDW4826484.1 DUF417 family protein [Shewanella fidelis]
MLTIIKPLPVANSVVIARILFAIFLLLTAIPRFSAADASYFNQQLAEVGLPALPWLAPLLGIVQLLVALALIAPQMRVSQVLLYLYAGLATVPMLMLLTHPVWLDSLGGFPAIGAGQGLIKYLGIVGLALFISSFYSGNRRLNSLAAKLMLTGIVLVMLWIGGMKFTQYEADGIEGLMRTSPLFSWIYDVFSVLHGSYFIGVIELIAVAGIALLPWSKKAYLAGLAIAALTFAATQTFVLTLPAYETSQGFAMLTGSGQFIVKDLALLACSLILIAKVYESKGFSEE